MDRFVIVRSAPGDTQLPASALVQAVTLAQVHPQTPVSLDQGRTFLPAAVAAERLRARGDDLVAAFVPTRVETYSTLAGYIAIFSGLFFGGPISLVAAVVAFDPGQVSIAVRLGFIAAAIVLGPLPLAAFALLGLRAIRRDPTLRGKGRAIFALVIAAIMLLACLAGVAGVVIAGLRS